MGSMTIEKIAIPVTKYALGALRMTIRVMIIPWRVWEEKRRSPQEPVTSMRNMITYHLLWVLGWWFGWVASIEQ